MPSLFEQPLNLIAKIVSTRLSVPHEILVRKKRDMTPFTNFLMWMSGDTPHRIHNIETEELRHFNMINKLVNEAEKTGLSIQHNSKELGHIYEDLRQDEVQLKDLNLKIDLIRIAHSLSHTYVHSTDRLSDFQASHSALLMEFKVSVENDIAQIDKCILQQELCFYRHKKFFCSSNCFLTSHDNGFMFNLKLQEYSKSMLIIFILCMRRLGNYRLYQATCSLKITQILIKSVKI